MALVKALIYTLDFTRPGEPVGVALAVPLDQPMRLHFTQIVTKLIEVRLPPELTQTVKTLLTVR